MSLPPGATPRSHALFSLAKELAEACPPELGVEIALAGSVSRGWSDEYSDIELNFWVDELEWPGEREAWLRSLGVERLIVDQEAHETGSWWIEFVYKGVWVEAGWHAFDHCDALLRRIIAGEVEDMFEAAIAEALHHAVPLRHGEHLRRWRSWLVEYPDAVRNLMIESALQGWREYRWYDLDLAFLLRPEPAVIARRIDTNIRSCLRTLHAVNRQWEPDPRKWIARWAETLELKPDRLTERIYAIYAQPLARESYADLLALIDETLALVPAEYDVSADHAKLASARDRLISLP